MGTRFAPDLDEAPTLEIPDFRRKAQNVLHTMIGADISAEEYLERLEIIEAALKDAYQEAVLITQAQTEYRIRDMERRLLQPTRRPSPSEPDMPAIEVPPTSPVPSLDIDWNDYESEK